MRCRGPARGGGMAKMKPVERLTGMPLIGAVLRHRFARFGTVGFSGTIVNVAVLYLHQEFLVRAIQPAETRLRFSLAGAIFLATLNNYLWNRAWTWKDREKKTGVGFFVQMGQYFTACGVSISFQYLFTLLLSRLIYYLAANIIAVVLAAVITYVLNDIWTFSVKKAGSDHLRRTGRS